MSILNTPKEELEKTLKKLGATNTELELLINYFVVCQDLVVLLKEYDAIESEDYTDYIIIEKNSQNTDAQTLGKFHTIMSKIIIKARKKGLLPPKGYYEYVHISNLVFDFFRELDWQNEQQAKHKKRK